MHVRLFIALVVLCLFLAETTCSGADTPNGPATLPTPKPDDADTPPVVIFKVLCDALRTNYPMLELAGWRDEEWPQEFAARIQAAENRQAAFEIMDELVCRLNDYHTRLSWPDRPATAGPPIRVEPVAASDSTGPDHGIWGRAHPPIEMPPLDGIAFAVTAAADGCGLAVGDEIVSVESVPVRTALEAAWRHAVGSSVAGKLRSAAGKMLQGPPDKDLKLVVRRAGNHEPQTLSISRSRMPAEPVISGIETEAVPIIRITRWSNERGSNLVTRFDELLARFRDKPCLVIDVRGNGGGEDGLAAQAVARFIKEPAIASISFHRRVPGLAFDRSVERITPRGPWRYEGRVAVLTDEGCMSACEHFVSGMGEAGALLCGTSTSGACGWIRPVPLPGGARLNVSQTFPLHTGGIPSPQLGIAPHIWAPRSLGDLRAGKDTALLTAMTWLKSNDRLPVRFQPLTH